MSDPTQTGLYGRILGAANEFDPSKVYLHKFDTMSEFEEEYNGANYYEPWVSAVVANEEVAF